MYIFFNLLIILGVSNKHNGRKYSNLNIKKCNTSKDNENIGLLSDK